MGRWHAETHLTRRRLKHQTRTGHVAKATPDILAASGTDTLELS
jgi:hypothetical protein